MQVCPQFVMQVGRDLFTGLENGPLPDGPLDGNDGDHRGHQQQTQPGEPLDHFRLSLIGISKCGPKQWLLGLKVMPPSQL